MSISRFFAGSCVLLALLVALVSCETSYTFVISAQPKAPMSDCGSSDPCSFGRALQLYEATFLGLKSNGSGAIGACFEFQAGLYDISADTVWDLRIFQLPEAVTAVAIKLIADGVVTWKGADSKASVPVLSVISNSALLPTPVSLTFSGLQFDGFQYRSVVTLSSGLLTSLTLTGIKATNIGPIGMLLNSTTPKQGLDPAWTFPSLNLTDVMLSSSSSSGSSSSLLYAPFVGDVTIDRLSLKSVALSDGASVLSILVSELVSEATITDTNIEECIVTDKEMIEGVSPGPIVGISTLEGGVGSAFSLSVSTATLRKNVGELLQIQTAALTSVVSMHGLVVEDNEIVLDVEGLFSVSADENEGTLSVTMTENEFTSNSLVLASLLAIVGDSLTVELQGNHWTGTICEYLCTGTAVAIQGNRGKIGILGDSFVGNSASLGEGGAIYAAVAGVSTFDITDCHFAENAVSDPGHGSVLSMASFDHMILTIRNSTFVDNDAVMFHDGGALYFHDNVRDCSTVVVIEDCSFEGNSGGAVRIDSFRYTPKPMHGKQAVSRLDLKLTGTVSFVGNDGGSGGAIHISPNENSPPEAVQRNIFMDGVIAFRGNVAGGDGGAICHQCGTGDGRVEVEGGSVSFNSNVANGTGGALYVDGCSSIAFGDLPVVISKNSANGLGGGIALVSVSSVQMSDSVSITSCTAGTGGGGMYVFGRQNSVPPPVFHFSTLGVSQCTADIAGGGAVLDYDGDFGWFTPEVTENRANVGGGGVFFVTEYTNELPNVHSNSAPTGSDFMTTPRSYDLKSQKNYCTNTSAVGTKNVFEQWFRCTIEGLSFADAFGNHAKLTLPETKVDFIVTFRSTTDVTFGVPPDDVVVVTKASGYELSALSFTVVVTYDGQVGRQVTGRFSAFNKEQDLAFKFPRLIYPSPGSSKFPPWEYALIISLILVFGFCLVLMICVVVVAVICRNCLRLPSLDRSDVNPKDPAVNEAAPLLPGERRAE